MTGTVAAPLTDFAGRERVGLRLTTTIDRTAFGVSWNAELRDPGVVVGDDVVITIDLEAERPDETPPTS